MANYDISDSASRPKTLNLASDAQLEKWANDPECNQRLFCESLLAKRSEARTFNPVTDVSEDARYIASHIVKHLWIIFIALLFLLAILFAILTNIK
jgi:hypothetical protein